MILSLDLRRGAVASAQSHTTSYGHRGAHLAPRLGHLTQATLSTGKKYSKIYNVAMEAF